MPTGKKNETMKFRCWSTQRKPKMIYLPEDGSYSGRDLIESDEWKVMQCTGLKDKNGTEIYEGDIVKCENGNFEVKWGHFTNNVNSDEYSEAHYGYYIGEDEQFEDFEQIWNANLFEVIGNIYENKETL